MDTLQDFEYSKYYKEIMLVSIAFILSILTVPIFFLDGVLRTSAIGIFAFVAVSISISGIWAWRSERNCRIRQVRDNEAEAVSATVTEDDMGLEPLPKYELPPNYDLNNSTLPNNQPSQTAQ